MRKPNYDKFPVCAVAGFDQYPLGIVSAALVLAGTINNEYSGPFRLRQRLPRDDAASGVGEAQLRVAEVLVGQVRGGLLRARPRAQPPA